MKNLIFTICLCLFYQSSYTQKNEKNYCLKTKSTKFCVKSSINDTKFIMYDKNDKLKWDFNNLSLNVELILNGRAFETKDYTIKNISKSKNTVTLNLLPKFQNISTDICIIDAVYTISEDGNWIEEQFLFHSSSNDTIHLTVFSLGWNYSSSQPPIQYFPIPFGQQENKKTLSALGEEDKFYSLADGALLFDNRKGIVIAKKPVDFEEPQLIGVSKQNNTICYGGAIQGIPTYRKEMLIFPKAQLDFYKTRYMFYKGKVETGLNMYKDYMIENGIGLPANYNPPINYCAYYENGNFWDRKAMLQSLKYTADLGCTLLYLDQGSENYFGSGQWDEVRLGKLDDFITLAHKSNINVGTLVGLHTNSYVFDEECWRKDSMNKPVLGDPWHPIGICPVSNKWQSLKTERLTSLYKSGMRFFSFDFNNFQNDGLCYDKNHLHSIPMNQWEHSKGVAMQQKMFKTKCPEALIEAHDWADSGGRTWPIYLFSSARDERWGFEYMWKTFEDYKSGYLHNLYYYNLAYDVPLYLHIKLDNDDINLASFWYTASTIRHFGIGNYAKIDTLQAKQVKQAIEIYKKYKDYFSGGKFYGIDPLTHIHEKNSSIVLLRFNDKATSKKCKVRLDKSVYPWIKKSSKIQYEYGVKPTIFQADDFLELEYELRPYDVSIVYIN